MVHFYHVQSWLSRSAESAHYSKGSLYQIKDEEMSISHLIQSKYLLVTDRELDETPEY